MPTPKSELTLRYMSLRELKPAARNPKEHATPEIRASIRRFGFNEALCINEATGLLVSGHGRLEALGQMRDEGEDPPERIRVARGGDWQVPVLRGVSFETEREAEAYLLAVNQLVIKGGWSDDEVLSQIVADLANVETPSELFLSQNFDSVSQALLGTGFDLDSLPRVVAVSGHERTIGNEPDETYTQKIQIPVYEPTGECPEVGELVDRTKYEQLIAEIESATLPRDVAEFLRVAATRHITFRYSAIAEYYAHAPANVQALMESSVLVIVDYQKAVENGFVRLTKRLAELATQSADIIGGDEE